MRGTFYKVRSCTAIALLIFVEVGTLPIPHAVRSDAARANSSRHEGTA